MSKLPDWRVPLMVGVSFVCGIGSPSPLAIGAALGTFIFALLLVWLGRNAR